MPTLFTKTENYIDKTISDFPQTRYQGSKYKLVNWIWECISFLEFESVIDLFGGTGAVSYLFKTRNKEVTFNDILSSNYNSGLALIENSHCTIENYDIEYVIHNQTENSHRIISDNFKGIYFTEKENEWLDRVIQNIFSRYKVNKYKKSLLLWTIFQSCIIKRPFNLFHRKNLYMRTNNVKRSFGNKTTWDKSFEYYFHKFSHEINNAIFSNDKVCIAENRDALNFKNNYDLVYIDTPYVSDKGVGVDYHNFYHFLEGICNYYYWEKNIDYEKKHRPLKQEKNRWSDKRSIKTAFAELFDHYRNSNLVISYRSDGIPSVDDLIKLVKLFKRHYRLFVFQNYRYVLSKNNNSHEILLVGWD